MIERRLNRSQIPQIHKTLKSGNVYTVRGKELTDKGVELFVIAGKPEKDERTARLSAWKAGKNWVGQIGEVKEERGYYLAIAKGM